MTYRRRTLVIGLAGLLVLLLPSTAYACDLRDPGCYVDDFAQKQMMSVTMSLWQINRAGLVLARWLEEVRGWLIERVLVDAFTALVRPAQFLLVLALIVAWLVVVISFLVQALIDLRWVDLRRAARPVLLAVVVFSAGGSLLQQTEQVRVLGGSVLHQAALAAVQTVQAPAIPTTNTGDMPDAAGSIYTDGTSCGTPARAVPEMALNDYAARYLWANADDIHCAEAWALAGAFQARYAPWADISDQESSARQHALDLAAQGIVRQMTGLLLTVGANVEQGMHLVFALALALSWFGLLLTLVVAVFLPTEALFTRQIQALLAVLRGSWSASFVVGLGLALMQVVVASGNGFLVLFCGGILVGVCGWQARHALAVFGSAAGAVSAATGGVPQAVGGMVRGWATTAALVTGMALTGGGGGMALTQASATLVRRAGQQVGDTPFSRAAGRVLTNRIADRIDGGLQDARLGQAADLSAAEAAWYERDLGGGAGDRRQQAARAGEQARMLRATVVERRAERARQAGRFGQAERLRQEAAQLRAGPAQLDDAKHPQGASTTRRAQIKAQRNQALRERRFADAQRAIRELRALEGAAVPPRPVSPRALRVVRRGRGTPNAVVSPLMPAPHADAEAPSQPAPSALPPPPGQVEIAYTDAGWVLNGHRVTAFRARSDGARILVTDAGSVGLTADDAARMIALAPGMAIAVSPLWGVSDAAPAPPTPLVGDSGALGAAGHTGTAAPTQARSPHAASTASHVPAPPAVPLRPWKRKRATP